MIRILIRDSNEIAKEIGIMKTFSARNETTQHDWYIVNAEGLTLGRMSAEIAHRLRGKHKPEYTAHVDTGDYIVVINADKIKVTGNKENDKMYHHHTQYPGGLKSFSFKEMMARSPEEVIKRAVKGMLPRTPLGRVMFRKLKVYAGTEHPHTAQQPAQLNLQ
jgi:large subunit ribosomal protein L13